MPSRISFRAKSGVTVGAQLLNASKVALADTDDVVTGFNAIQSSTPTVNATQDLRYHILSGRKPRGISGTGLVSLVALRVVVRLRQATGQPAIFAVQRRELRPLRRRQRKCSR